MFYFCYFDEKKRKNTTIKALYNGKVAFLARANRNEIESYFADNSMNKSFINDIDIISHEHKHQNLFMYTFSGKILSGFCVVSRFMYLVFNKVNFIKRYYKLRSIFYLNMHVLHEEIVDNLLLSGDQQVLKADIIKIKKQNKIVIEKWKKYKLYPNAFSLLLCWIWGQLFGSSFTIVHGEWKKEKWDERWISRGFVNNVKRIEKNDNFIVIILKKIMNNVRIERWFKNNIDTDWKWMLVKFKTEYELVIDNREYIMKNYNMEPDDYYDTYLNKILFFVSQWCRLNKSDLIFFTSDLFTTIKNFIKTNKIVSYKSEWLDMKGFRKFINFFYLHGN